MKNESEKIIEVLQNEGFEKVELKSKDGFTGTYFKFYVSELLRAKFKISFSFENGVSSLFCETVFFEFDKKYMAYNISHSFSNFEKFAEWVEDGYAEMELETKQKIRTPDKCFALANICDIVKKIKNGIAGEQNAVSN